jgi:hypothetical protein
MSFKGPLQILRLWRSWGKISNIFFQNRAHVADTQGIVTWNLELGKLGAREEKFEGKEFPGESSPDPGIPLSYARTDHPRPSKNEQNEKSSRTLLEL